MSSSAIPPSPGLGPQGRNINGCSINVDHFDSHHYRHQEDPNNALPLPTTLSIFFDPDRNFAFFRLRTEVSLEVNAETRKVPFFLHISPDKIGTLSLYQHDITGHLNKIHASTKTYLRFRLANPGSISVIAPRSLPAGQMHAANLAAGNMLDAGGRAVEVDELASFSSSSRPPLSLFAGAPPAYPDAAADGPPQPAPACGSKRQRRKRLRTSSPSPSDSSRSRSRSWGCSSSSSPRYNTWQHLSLAVGEREKIMAELLRRTEKRETAMNELLRRADKKEERLSAILCDIDEKRARVTDETHKLTALTASSQDCRLQRLQEPQQHEDTGPTARRASQVSTASQASTVSPAPSGPSAGEDKGSAVSVSTDVSDRVQAYIATQLDGLRDEMRTLQRAMANDMGQVVDRRLEEYVEAEDMFDTIRGAVDESIAGIRDRILDVLL